MSEIVKKKYKFKFSENNILDSVAYLLVSKYNIEPSILRAEVEDDGGTLILELKGDSAKIESAVKYLGEEGIGVTLLADHIYRDKKKCYSCGECLSICPTKSFTVDPVTAEIHLNIDTCIACGSCLTACPTHAVTMNL
jgi:NAD-dependent dihydropyrimidine dehydrogenase PreA subunit